MYNKLSFRKIYLALQDLFGFFLGLWLGLAVRYLYLPTQEEFLSHLPLFSAVFLIWVIMNYINGLYDLDKEPDSIIFHKQIWESGGFSLVCGIIFFYIVPEKNITPKTILVLVTISGYLVINFLRILAFKFILPKTSAQKIMFVGFSKEVKELLEILEENHFFYKTHGILLYQDKNKEKIENKNIKIYEQVTDLKAVLEKENIDQIILTPHLKQKKEVVQKLYEVLYLPIKIKDLHSFYEEITGRVPPSTFKEAWFLDHLRNLQNPFKLGIRRGIDIVAATILGIITLILFPFIALAIKIDSEGPILIRQKRVGKKNTIFTMYKFRSMYALSEDGLAETDGPEFAKKDDDRITPVGKFLRQTRLDELPQVWNLFKGDLTLIGPRPERPEIVDKLEKRMPYYSLRHIVKPGITSWAVLHQNYTDTMEESLQKLQYDLFYIKNRSFLLDLSISLRTVNVIVRMMGQ